MLTNDAIHTATEIRLYSDDLLSVLSDEDHDTYWFSKRGLPWGTRENSMFLRNRNYDPADGIQISSESAVKIIEGWEH